MAPAAIEKVTVPIDQLTGEERYRQLKNSVGDRPLDRFVYGPHPISGAQTDPVKQVRIPTFDNLLDERAFRKLHMAACIRWLGENGYNNEGAGGHVTVRDPIKPDHFWYVMFYLTVINGSLTTVGSTHSVNRLDT
jgi:hypothetical protein